MAMMINTNSNFDAFRSLSFLNQNRIAAQKEVQRASTTRLDINDAIDNVSAYSIEESLRIRTRILNQASENIQNDTALLKTAQGSGSSIVDSIKEIQRLAISAADESLTDNDRMVIQKDVNRLVNQIVGDAQITFNGRNLIDGSATTGNDAIATVLSNNSLLSGTTADTALTALQNSSGVNLGITASDRITASYVKDGSAYTTSFTVGNNTLEDIFVNLNKINGVTTADNGMKSLTDAAFVGGGKGIVTAPEPLTDPETLRPDTPEVARPTKVINEPEEVSAPGEEVAAPLVPSEFVPENLEAPSNETVSSAYDELGAAVRAFGENLGEDLPEGLGEFISSLQDEMLARQDDGSVKYLSDFTASESYQNLSEDAKALADENADAINTALANPDYADKVAAFNAANTEYNTAVEQYNFNKTAYDAVQAGAEKIDSDDPQHAEAVANYSTQDAAAYVQYREQQAAYNQYLEDKATYDKYVSDKAQWDKYDADYAKYAAYKKEYEEELYPQYQKDLAYYNLMSASAVQNDGINGLSVTARTPGLEGQISGVSINVTDSSGRAKTVANTALNNFKTTTFAEDERENNSFNFQIGETIGQTINMGLDDMRAEAFGLKGKNGNIINVLTQENANAALATINNALSKATEQLQTIGSSEKRLGYIADSLAIEIGNIQEPDLMIRNAGMAKTLTIQTIDIFHRDRMQSMFAMANQYASSVLALLR
ncbi:MAG: hypothetical protein IJQ85_03700 [Selenomonadaceae bacterium]|nr:hypothetical protein [Selenomonadaceae bacterium]